MFYGTLGEVKAEELKNDFILNASLTNSNKKISNDNDIDVIEKIAGDPAIMKLMELYNKPEFQQLQETFSSPEFQKAIQAANKLQKYFERSNK